MKEAKQLTDMKPWAFKGFALSYPPRWWTGRAQLSGDGAETGLKFS